ncbi:2Fe-2S iron-sulfur cluster-binding protein [Halalkalicoccus sp. NIPERK01]|nr:2Fe-2S iron-sulfur cluster-binding protein [Halalkalicoccus sp. NIPERK01]
MSHEVVLERSDRVETIDVPGTETVLDAAERAGIALPFGCLTGACATCVGRLLAGEVHHSRPPRALKDRHLEAGYVLLCIARPRAPCRIRVGADVQSGLVENPWK